MPLERAALVDLCHLGDVVEVKRLAALGAYEAAGLHEIDGHRTLRRGCGPRPTATRRRPRAWPAGPESCTASRSWSRRSWTVGCPVGQLEVILARVSASTWIRFVEHCPSMLADFAWLDVSGTAVLMDRWRQLADTEDPGPEPPERESEVFLSRTLDGRGDLPATWTRISSPCSRRRCASRIPRTSTCRCPSGVLRRWARSPRRSSTARQGQGRPAPPPPQRGHRPRGPPAPGRHRRPLRRHRRRRSRPRPCRSWSATPPGTALVWAASPRSWTTARRRGTGR